METDTPKDRRRAEHSDLSPSQRSLRARAAANARWAKADGSQGTQAARETFMATFELAVDPQRQLPADERARRAARARKAHMQQLAYRRHRATA